MSAKQPAPVKFLDLQAQFDTIRDEAMAAIREVVESQQFILGPKVAELEARVADYCGCAHAVGVSSGTDALLVALMALGIGRGDEVVTSTFSFFASAGCIHRLGAKPVFVDVDPDTYNIDPAKLKAAITPRTRAIMPVHLFGQCADMTAVMRIADARGIPVVEDAAQAIGAEHAGQTVGAESGAQAVGAEHAASVGPKKDKSRSDPRDLRAEGPQEPSPGRLPSAASAKEGKPRVSDEKEHPLSPEGATAGLAYTGRAGSFGALGCFSFFPTKNLGAFGEGGMVTTNDKELADRARMLRHHGDRGRYDHVLVGGNFRLQALQAAVLLVKLNHLDDWTAKRQANAALYRKLFADAGLVPRYVTLPVERPGRHTYNQFVIAVDRRDELSAFLTERGIGHSIYYPKPLHLQPCFASLGHKPGDFPLAERACARVLALPIYPELPPDAAKRVVEALGEFLAA